MATVELTKANFEDVISKNNYVLIDFWAPWCGPCRTFGPVFEKAAETYPDMVFAKVNTDVEQEIAGMFRIRSIPTLVVFREQIGVFSQPGALPAAALDSVIEQVRALDMGDVRKDLEKQEAGTAG